jgi:hypothetical protein
MNESTHEVLNLSSAALGRHSLLGRKLYGQIQEAIYAVKVTPDRPIEEREAIVSEFIQQIHQWYASSPLKMAFVPISEETIRRQWLDDMQYHQMMMALHRPSPLFPTIPSSFIITLKGSAGISVDLYTHYSSRNQVHQNWVHLYQIFMACTALVYCLCEYKSRADLIDLSSAEVNMRIERCRKLLERFGTGWPQSARYQSIFDILVKAYYGDTVEETTEVQQPQPPDIPGITATEQDDLPEAIYGFQPDLVGSPSNVMRGIWGDTV